MEKETIVKDLENTLNRNVICKLKKAEKQIEKGEVVDAEIVFSGMRKKYEY